MKIFRREWEDVIRLVKVGVGTIIDMYRGKLPLTSYCCGNVAVVIPRINCLITLVPIISL